MRKPDLHLPVTIESQKGKGERGIIFKNIPCRIYLPENRHDQVMVHLDLNDAQAGVVGLFGNLFWKMSVRGWLRHGGCFWQVEAHEAYINNGDWPMVGYGNSFQVIDLPLEVWDLQITDCVLDNRDEGIQQSEIGRRQKVAKPKTLPKATEEALAVFWLTYNDRLPPPHIEEQHADGQIKIRSVAPLELEIAPGLRAKFVKHYTYTSEKVGKPHELLRRGELVAEIRLPPTGNKPVQIPDAVIKRIDDFLLLVSVGSRWRTVCLGWQIHQFPYKTTRYRHGVALPSHLENPRRPAEQSIRDCLIELSSLDKFLSGSIEKFEQMPTERQELVRQVLLNLVHAQQLDLQSAFITFYSALEMLVTDFRRQADLEFLLPPDEEWPQLQTDLREFLKNHPLLSGNSKERKARRSKAYEKVGEFNRIAFSTAFDAFCGAEAHLIKHDDLWPVNGQNSLSGLRNRLVHGEVEGRDQTNALSDAKLHMEWLLERCVLAIFGWPLAESYVSPGALRANSLAYKPSQWQTSRAVLFALPLPDSPAEDE